MGPLLVLRMRVGTLVCGAVLSFAVLATYPAAASRLPPDDCRELRATRDALANLGVRGDMKLGPIWAAANLSPDRIANIKRYLLATEQVLFRCRSIPRVLSDGMDFAENMPAAKPFGERRVFPLPVRKPSVRLRQSLE
ncbi:MAG: hypothetical protein AAGJ70_09925 [Pseudomonadota bacterium]